MMMFVSTLLMSSIGAKEYYFPGGNIFMETSAGMLLWLFPFCIFILSLYLFNFNSKMEFYIFLSSFSFITFLCSLCFMFNSPLLFFVSYELVLWPMSFCIWFFSKDYSKLQSIVFMMVLNLLGSVPFMIFIFFCYDFNLGISFPYSYLVFWGSFIYFLMSLLLLSKIPIFMLHFWLTKAHVEGSAFCSMILASLMLKMGTIGLFKFGSKFLLGSPCSWVVSFSLTGSLIFVLIMNRFFDVKLLVALSSLVHMGLMWAFSVVMSNFSLFSSVLMMVIHGIISFFFFMLVSLVYEKSHSRNSFINSSMESIDKFIYFSLFTYVLLNMGVPPFASFFLEVYFVSLLYTLFSLKSAIVFVLIAFLMVLNFMFFITKLSFGKKFMIGVNSGDFLHLTHSALSVVLLFMLPFFAY